MIAVADVIKEDSPQAIRQLQDMGIRVVMLTGDNERTARAVGKAAGVDDVIAGVLPDGKEETVRLLFHVRIEQKVEREEVAKVTESGIVTGLKQGTATITVTTEDGEYTSSVTFTVENKIVKYVKGNAINNFKNTTTKKDYHNVEYSGLIYSIFFIALKYLGTVFGGFILIPFSIKLTVCSLDDLKKVKNLF